MEATFRCRATISTAKRSISYLERDADDQFRASFALVTKPPVVLRSRAKGFLEGGARGYISKSAKAEELVEAVKIVAAGGRYLERDLASEVALTLTSSGEHLKELSSRELDILRLLAQGKSLDTISGELAISYKTVANTCTMIKQKMMLETTNELIKFAIEMHRC
jgi:two-component system, NarL family, invasion response regulator UvrY